MLISHRYQFIYTKTVKTASTSVESYFERFCLPEGESFQEYGRDDYESATGIIGYRGRDVEAGKRCKWRNHMPALEIKEKIGDAIWNSYFKFCVIRCPFDKAISGFEHFGKEHQLPSGPAGDAFRSEHPSCDTEQLRFLHWLITVGPPIDRNKYLINGKFCLDDVIRYDSLHDDLERICGRIGVPWEPEWLPKLKGEKRRKASTISNLYTPEAIRIVRNAYALELGGIPGIGSSFCPPGTLPEGFLDR